MEKENIKILFASYECAPFYKEGGLGDVAGSLPRALAMLGADIRLILPYYNAIKKKYPDLKIYKKIKITFLGQQNLIIMRQGKLPNSGVPVYFIDSPYFAVDRIYEGKNRTRFIIFSYLIAEINKLIGWQPHLIHLNDWHTGAAAMFLKKKRSKIKTLFTIHNIAYTGGTNITVLKKFGFKNSFISKLSENKVNLMREAVLNADMVSTVSPTYAREILNKEYGYDMTDALKARKKVLVGILNGLDYADWNPETDGYLKYHYNMHSIQNKALNKRQMKKLAHFSSARAPLFVMISRMVGQKGYDLLAEVFEDLMRLNINLIITGIGEKKYEKFFRAMGKKYSHKFKPFIKFDVKLASQLYAAADVFLMPSKYEPCGLGQLIAMRYGALPLVKLTGGLKDTVTKDSGFYFIKYQAKDFLFAIKEAITLYREQDKWREMRASAMRKDFSWGVSAKKYLGLYKKIIAKV